MIPILYSFRRCPYAIRARLAIQASGVQVELREVVLRDKPDAFLEASASGTVPCLVTKETTLDESLDIMMWALRQNDPGGWLDMPDKGWDWIARCDGPFKHALDRTKYATRYPEEVTETHIAVALDFLAELDDQLDGWLFDSPSIADFAMLPFVRQFAFIDKDNFDVQPFPKAQSWLDRFLASSRFAAVMKKYPQWMEGDTSTPFP